MTQDNTRAELLPVAVTPEDAALAQRFWRVHPSEIQDMGITREEFYAREIARHRIAATRPSVGAEDLVEHWSRQQIVNLIIKAMVDAGAVKAVPAGQAADAILELLGPALRASPPQEPVAWLITSPERRKEVSLVRLSDAFKASCPGWTEKPLYAHPQPDKPQDAGEVADG